MNEVVDRAARASSGWAPATPTERRVEEIEAFAAAARRVYHADPRDVDDYLREGAHAFLGLLFYRTLVGPSLRQAGGGGLSVLPCWRGFAAGWRRGRGRRGALGQSSVVSHDM